MEALCNIAVGLVVSTVANLAILQTVLGVELHLRENIEIGAAFTIVSLMRSYALRRLFNGKSVWSAIRSRFCN